MEGSLAQKRRELGHLETQLLSAHRASQETLEEDRRGLAERERQLALKEKEVWLRDEQLLRRRTRSPSSAKSSRRTKGT